MLKRYQFTLLAMLSNMICYADRTNIGIVILQFSELSESQQGFVLSAFFAGYICTQIPGGVLSGMLGGKKVLCTGVLVWTISDLMTIPFHTSFALLLLARISMGLGEGVNFPSVHKMCACWIPVSERTTLVTIITSGQDLGTVLALCISPQIIHFLGWPWVFVFFGGLAGTWLILFSVFGASDPERHRSISEHERQYIIATRREGGAKEPRKLPWRVLTTSSSVWAIVTAHTCFNWGWYVLLGFLPKYFKDHLHVDLHKHTPNLIIPYVCAMIGMLVSGRVSDICIESYRWNRIAVRKLMNTIGMLGPALFLFLLGLERPNDPYKATAYLAVALGCGRFVVAGYWTNMIDVTPNAGQIMGLSNTIATIPGILGNAISSYILSHSPKDMGWSYVFWLAAVIYAVGCVVYLMFASTQPLVKSGGGVVDGVLHHDDEEESNLLESPVSSDL